MKVKPLTPHARDAARAVLADAGVVHPRDIDVEAIAARHGAYVLYGVATTARGSLVRAGGHAIIWIDKRAIGTPHGRFTGAHELAHKCLHEPVNHFAQCHGDAREAGAENARSGNDRTTEREADHFAAEFLMPESLAAPYCAHVAPTLEDVERLSRVFNTSLESSAIRYAELTRAACAVIFAKDGRVKWAAETQAFSGRGVRRRALHPASAAAWLHARPRRGDVGAREVPASAWESDRPVLEHAVRVGPGEILSWLRPA